MKPNNVCRLILFLLLLSRFGQTFSQNEVKDSLLKVIQTATVDTVRISAQKSLLDYLDHDAEWTVVNTAIQSECREKIKTEKGARLAFFKEAYAVTLSNEGIVVGKGGDRDKAKKLFEEALSHFRSIKNLKGEGTVLNNLAFNYNRQGNIPKAIEIYSNALVIFRKINSIENLGQTLLNLGSISYNLNQAQETLDYLLEAEGYLKQSKDPKVLSRCYLNLSSVYRSKQDSVKMFYYMDKATEILERMNDNEGLGFAYNNMATYYKEKKNYSQAKILVIKGLEVRKLTGDKKNIASSLNNYAGILAGEGNWDSVKIVLDQANEIGVSIKSPEILQNNHDEFYKYYQKKQDNGLALDHYKKYIVFRDSLQNDKNKKLSIKQNMQFEFEKKEALLMIEQEKQNLANREKLQLQQLQYDYDRKQRELNTKTEMSALAMKEELRRKQLMFENKAQQDKIKSESDRKEFSLQENIKRQELENRNQRTLTYFFIIAFGVMCALAFFIFRGLQQNKKARQIIELQKEKAEEQTIQIREKQKEIVDSITYAKRLQDAILPPVSLLKLHLPEHFIFYQPKDIVAGDFYWLETADDSVLIAAADCTGHGVPGAMVSVVCSNALNRTVKEFGITRPGELLDKVRDLVIETFQKSESEVRDGMDISLLNLKRNKEKITVQWAGANNPLWFVRKISGEMESIKPDKQSIGRSDTPVPFRTVELEMEKSDTLFLLSDGFADQFGGDKGKKFKYKQLQAFLLSNIHLSMEEQKAKLHDELISWKGGLEQVDDILIIGIRL
ncbi:MAG: SpoIIE family protein phosphatase [Bacteroidota bacterium]|nr:SpoIIE family protein phosphatase [Bacteroidota bacterium]